jgi:hypothetical protein
MAEDKALRDQLIELIDSGHAHATFDATVKDFPIDRIGVRPPGSPHSAWELIEHLRIAQHDILKFSQSADHVSPDFPDGYWPKSAAPENPADWAKSIRGFREDRAAFVKLLGDTSRDLYEKFSWGDGQTLLREALLIADHNAYHLGQLMLIRRILEAG